MLRFNIRPGFSSDPFSSEMRTKILYFTLILPLRIRCFYSPISRWLSGLRQCPAKSEGRGFDSRWCHWNFSVTKSFRRLYDLGVDTASNRNEYQEYFLKGRGGRDVVLTTLPPSCANCLEIWEPQGT